MVMYITTQDAEAPRSVRSLTGSNGQYTFKILMIQSLTKSAGSQTSKRISHHEVFSRSSETQEKMTISTSSAGILVRLTSPVASCQDKDVLGYAAQSEIKFNEIEELLDSSDKSTTSAGQGQSRQEFEPSRALTNVHRYIHPSMVIKALSAGIDLRSSNYQGDITDSYVVNAILPNEFNCALRICGIPAEAETKEIFNVFQGKVFAFSKQLPVPGCYDTCACRVAFTTRDAAERMMDRINLKGVFIRGYRLRAMWNRDASPPRPYSERHQSRVIRITGPRRNFTADGIEDFFRQTIKFDLVGRREWIFAGEGRTVELSFDSIRGQSRAAMKCFKEFIRGTVYNDQFSIFFAPDPCEKAGNK